MPCALELRSAGKSTASKSIVRREQATSTIVLGGTQASSVFRMPLQEEGWSSSLSRRLGILLKVGFCGRIGVLLQTNRIRRM